MRSSRVVRTSDCQCQSRNSPAWGRSKHPPAQVESEGRKMKQCWKQFILKIKIKTVWPHACMKYVYKSQKYLLYLIDNYKKALRVSFIKINDSKNFTNILKSLGCGRKGVDCRVEEMSMTRRDNWCFFSRALLWPARCCCCCCCWLLTRELGNCCVKVPTRSHDLHSFSSPPPPPPPTFLMEQKKRRRGGTREKIIDRETAQHEPLNGEWKVRERVASPLAGDGSCISVREIADNGKKDKRFIPRGEWFRHSSFQSVIFTAIGIAQYASASRGIVR